MLLAKCFGLHSVIFRDATHTPYWEFLLAPIPIAVGPHEWLEDKGDTIPCDACNHTPSNHRTWNFCIAAVRIQNFQSVLCGFSRPHNDRVQLTVNMLTKHGGCFPAGSTPWRFVFLANRGKEESPTKCHFQSARYFGNVPNLAAYGNTGKKG